MSVISLQTIEAITIIMDKIENKVAKNKIELFIKQTRELQKQLEELFAQSE